MSGASPSSWSLTARRRGSLRSASPTIVEPLLPWPRRPATTQRLAYAFRPARTRPVSCGITVLGMSSGRYSSPRSLPVLPLIPAHAVSSRQLKTVPSTRLTFSAQSRCSVRRVRSRLLSSRSRLRLLSHRQTPRLRPAWPWLTMVRSCSLGTPRARFMSGGSPIGPQRAVQRSSRTLTLLLLTSCSSRRFRPSFQLPGAGPSSNLPRRSARTIFAHSWTLI